MHLFTSVRRRGGGLRRGGDVAVGAGAKLCVRQVGKLVNALLPATAAQVVPPDFLQVVGEDLEAVGSLRLVCVYLRMRAVPIEYSSPIRRRRADLSKLILKGLELRLVGGREGKSREEDGEV